MDEAKERAPLAKETLSRLAVTEEAREEALDCLEAPFLGREAANRREREHGLEFRGGELAAFALNRGEERGELRGGEHGRASGEGSEQKGEELLERLLGLGRSRGGELARGEALLELASVESGLTARGEREARPGEIGGEELMRRHRKESEGTEERREASRPP